MTDHDHEIGMIGLGTMGQNLLLNMADHGYSVAGYDLSAEKVQELAKKPGDGRILATGDLETFVQALRQPRAIMMLVPAGRAVDAVIDSLRPHLLSDDIIIDGGNSHFVDTNRRVEELSQSGVHFVGMGVSGGAEGARLGPSLMPGGPRVAYERIRPVFEAVAAKVDDEPCIAYLGERSAGHYVKMVHNGIEYGIMQLLAESYDLMHRGLGLGNDELHSIFDSWNQAELASFLVEITAEIFLQEDDLSDGRLIDQILDTAKQKGTGKWTSQQALDLGVPTPSIDIAVTMRYLSALKDERLLASQVLPARAVPQKGNRGRAIAELRNALYAAMILTYTQGMSLLRAASEEHGYDLDLEGTARIWRGGCIIRSAVLEDFRRAYKSSPELTNLLRDPEIGAAVSARALDLRATVTRAAALRIPAGGFSASLAYLDAYRSGRLPANLIQAQRDHFGAHTYERLDAEGTFHTDWG